MILDGLTPPRQLPQEEALELLRHGQLTVEGRVMDASNATLYCAVSHAGLDAACVYKPVMGERPLWDFPDGTLAGREQAAFEISQASGWQIVPPTVLRDGPAGTGMVQLWVETDEQADLLTLIRRCDDPRLRRIAVFDAVINNADRKGGHVLPGVDGQLYGVDHGVSFHADDKLRTVLWQWAGRTIPAVLLEGLHRLSAELDTGLGARLGELLTAGEVRRTRERVGALLASRQHPRPSEDWPAVPWPPI